MKKIATLLVTGFLLGVMVGNAGAITLDDFGGEQNITANPPAGTNSSSLATTSAVRGVRSLRIEAGGSGPSFLTARATVFSGAFFHSQDSGVTGRSEIVWDGDTAATLNPAGLGRLNLRQDGGDAFRFEVISFDLAGGLPANLTVTVYDSSDPTGAKYSRGTVSLSNQITTRTNVDLPFANLTISGPGGGADLTQAGAVVLSVQGGADLDLQLDWVGTNGQCRLLPDSTNRVIDLCGVCGGDDSSCKGCDGVPNSGAVVDRCGECGGTGAGCLDCKGVAFGPAKQDRCGVCEGDGLSCLQCRQTDQMALLAALDGLAKKQEAHSRAVAKELRQIDSRRSTSKWLDQKLKQVHSLQIRNWILSWTFPIRSTICESVQFCPLASLTYIAEEYTGHAGELRDASLEILRRLTLRRGKTLSRDRRNINKSEKLYSEAIALLATVPKVQSSCK